MNGRFFKILFNNTLKVVPCSKTLEQLLTSASQAFAVPISELNSCSYTDKENDVFSIDNEEDFKVLLSFMEKENMKAIKLTFAKKDVAFSYISMVKSVNVSKMEESKKPQQGTADYEKAMAKREIQRIVKRELLPIKT